jgi:hypothetical protein
VCKIFFGHAKAAANATWDVYSDTSYLFEHAPRWLVRAAAAAGLGIAMALYVVLKERAAISVDQMIATLVGVPAFMTTAGLLRATADTTRQRLHAGQQVGAVLRLLFGAGVWSVVVWCVVLPIVGFPLVIWPGNMTWARSAG